MRSHSSVSELLSQVERNIRTRRLFRRGASILVAVSGGLDSMVLLHVLNELARTHAWRLTVGHLNHQLRGRSSDADERLVRRTAEQMGIPVITEREDVAQFSRAHKLSLEMAARKLRHDFLARTAARLGARQVALAHQADDQLELFFLRLLRGSGGEGLTGMQWRNPSSSDPTIELVRPLLDQPKSALGLFAAAYKVPFREDATNAMLTIQRNRIRHQLLPLLRKEYQPALDRTIRRVMDILGAEAEFVSSTAKEWLESRGGASGPRRPALRNAPGFEDLPLAVQRRCLQWQLLELGVPGDFDLVEELRANANRPVSVGAGCRVVRNPAGTVQLEKTGPAAFHADFLELDLKERAGQVAFSGSQIRWRLLAGRRAGSVPRKQAGIEYFDADRVGTRVVLRHWRPGDRFQPIGMPGPLKLQDFFTNEKVLRNRRHELMVATTAQGEVFWVEELRISEQFKLSKQTKRRLQWCWERL